MPLPTSGAISLGAIQTEFGGSNPASASEYYAGGSYVPSGTSGTNGAVPSSGSLAFSKFYGTAAAVVSISDRGPGNYSSGTAGVYIGYQLNSNGKVYETPDPGAGPYEIENWVTPTSVASGYEVKATLVSGSLAGTSSATGTWLSLSSTREWGVITAYIGTTAQAEITVEIRKTGTTTVLDSAYISLTASSV